jgi:DNA-binding transcriptional LysR family regulator
MHTDIGDVVMNRTHPLARLDPPLAGADLAGHAWVTSPPGSVCHQWFRRLFADVPEDPYVRHLVDDFATQLSLVASGDVIALIPRLARPPLGEGLVSRPLRRKPKRDVHAAWRRSANASPAIQAVLAELASAISPEDASDSANLAVGTTRNNADLGAPYDHRRFDCQHNPIG